MRERRLDDGDDAYRRLIQARRLIDLAEDARKGAGRADVGAMAVVRRRPWCFDVRAEDALLVSLAERNEHDEELRHQGQASAEATQPVQT